jgi:hypothetical protein
MTGMIFIKKLERERLDVPEKNISNIHDNPLSGGIQKI